MMHALIVSPIPSDPIDQGNAARIGRFCDMLRYRGYSIHFVYYGMEGISPYQRTVMSQRWDSFHYVQPKVSKRQTGVDGFGIDDYCGVELCDFLVGLQEDLTFDIAIINYVWTSRAITCLNPSTYCILDTHDIFGGRHDLLQAEGVPPTWFYCAPDMEKKGLDRADCVIAIQNEEAKILADRTATPVVTIGHILPSNSLPPPARRILPLRVGYMASDNPSNRRSLEELFDAIEARREVLNNMHFVVGGRISQRIPPGSLGFETLGFVADPTDFYRKVDLVINPNISGTGLKIKTVEALSYNMPFVTTRAGMCGIHSEYKAHSIDDVAGIVDYLCTIDMPDILDELSFQSRAVFEEYSHQQVRSFDHMISMSIDRKLEKGHLR